MQVGLADDARSQRLLEPGGAVRIGRAPGPDVWSIPWENRLSRSPSIEMELEDDGLRVHCLESARNGFSFDGVLVREAHLQGGDSFQVGDRVVQDITDAPQVAGAQANVPGSQPPGKAPHPLERGELGATHFQCNLEIETFGQCAKGIHVRVRHLAQPLRSANIDVDADTGEALFDGEPEDVDNLERPVGQVQIKRK